MLEFCWGSGLVLIFGSVRETVLLSVWADMEQSRVRKNGRYVKVGVRVGWGRTGQWRGHSRVLRL